MNELITIENVTPIQLFSEGGLDAIIEKIEAEAKKQAVDISTAKGRDEVKSLAFKIAKSKTAIDKMGKELTAEWKEKSKKVDAERSRAWDRLEALQKEIRQPLTDWENRDKIRTQEHEDSLAEINSLVAFQEQPTAAQVQANIDSLKRFHNRDWEEFSVRAKNAIEDVSKTLDAKLAAAQKAEADKAELERLKKAEAERLQKERDDKLQAEAAEKARLEAEKKAAQAAAEEAARVKAEQEKAEKERQRIEQEKQEAETRAAKAEADRIAAEEKAKADAIAAEERAKKAAEEAKQAAIKAEQQAKERERIAAENERKRLEEIARKEAEETAKREADKKHRAKINGEALAVIAGLTGEDIDEKESSARKIVEAIAKGQVPHIKIAY